MILLRPVIKSFQKAWEHLFPMQSGHKFKFYDSEQSHSSEKHLIIFGWAKMEENKEKTILIWASRTSFVSPTRRFCNINKLFFPDIDLSQNW